VYRRTALAALAAGSITAVGCLSRESSAPDSSAKNGSESTTLTADGVTATFSVDGGQQPTEDTASARLTDDVIVTGTMDPTGCNYPDLERVDYNATDGVVHVQIGVVDRYPDREVVCDNASYGYTCRCVVDDGTPETVEVVHAYAGREIRSFTLALG
jgi:hypothetical protein